jgi:ADP-dependent NAD(P)H-hydrate dehydratase
MTADRKHIHHVPTPPARPADAHKGSFGRVLVVGGSVGMAGAPSLAALSALRSGAGLVTIAVPESVQPAVSIICPCATTIPLPETRDGRIDPPAAQRRLKRLGYLDSSPGGNPPDVLAIGPGVGRGPVEYGVHFWQLIDAFRELGVPAVIDADALNIAPQPDRQGSKGWQELDHARTIITPHPGELARLLKTTTGQVQADREGHAVRTAQAMRAYSNSKAPPPVVVLKGAGTVVTDGEFVYINNTGNPGMATGGSGDVLTGMIAALIGQNLTPFDAAIAGVYFHGRAGDIAAKRLGQISLIASDLIDALPEAFQQKPLRGLGQPAKPSSRPARNTRPERYRG